MNEDSKALYHELVTNKIIPEIKEDHDNELTKEEIDLIGSHLDKEIEDLKQKYNKSMIILKNTSTKIKKQKKDRNSYSKTDHDATFMRMKEDHMKKKWTT